MQAATRAFEGIALGDARRTRRLLRSVEAIARSPRESFPDALGSTAASEAWYRLINHDAVQHDVLVSNLVAGTVDRTAAHDGVVLVLHDTSEASWPGLDTRRA